MPRIVHFEIPADNPGRAVDFYQKVFDWKVEKWEGQEDYWLITTGEAPEPGIDGAIQRRSGQSGVVNTVAVLDLDEYVQKVVNAGGKIALPKTAVPAMGWLAYCIDSEGNLFGMMQMDPNAI